MGRPTKLDDLTAKRIIDALKAGVSRRGASEGAGIDQATLSRWMASGRDGDEPYCAFRQRVLDAEAKAEREMVDVLFSEAKSGKWQPALAWLERQRPREWGKRDTVEHVDAPVEQAGSDVDVARSVLAALESRKAG